jgi:hypothetical protein
MKWTRERRRGGWRLWDWKVWRHACGAVRSCRGELRECWWVRLKAYDGRVWGVGT